MYILFARAGESQSAFFVKAGVGVVALKILGVGVIKKFFLLLIIH